MLMVTIEEGTMGTVSTTGQGTVNASQDLNPEWPSFLASGASH